ncbi:uncharacterized protein LOC128204884 [Mya arenaria]|uniref:uncharacterized protein LOC128204884 n=1 Tax=Mya arenaria TaxID=6604 RepID=UPI0022E16F56|nr:uncharacterized protein LOC128204884 [Mya arenaria]
MYSPEQLEFLNLASNGHNIILTGQGGTGKTYAIRAIVARLMDIKNVAVTATTGIAATQYTNGQTIHSWCGLGDGSISGKELSNLIPKEEKYLKARMRIEKCDVLVIDECSMLSQKMFDTIESICRNVKKNNAFFGGLQLILAGDFYHLPPVPDQLNGETGKFCFQSKAFYSSVPHHVDLKTVFRQEDNNLIQSINALEKGELSDDTAQFINTVTKDIDHNEETVFLFATNYKAKLHNHDQVMKMEGDLKTYKSRNEGDAYYLNRFQAPPILGLKISCKVMLVTNLSDHLVNGLTGRVKELTEDHVKVHFEMVDQIVTIERKLFVKFDPVSRRALAKRVQFPLILAFGLTIHKSQGMSLKSIIIDCEDAKIPGQIGVALGRATSSEQLQVKNFKPSLVSKHPQAIKNFYDCSFKPSCDDLSCCKAEFISRDLEVDLFAPFDIDNIELTEDEDPDDITGPENFVNEDEPSSEELPEFGPSPFPEYINMNTIVLDVRNEYANTPFENNISALSDNVLQNDKK